MSTIRVSRANVILDIRPEEKVRYMEMGYSVIDTKTGKVVEAALSNDVNALRTEVISLRKALAEKDNEIAELKSKAEKKAKKAE